VVAMGMGSVAAYASGGQKPSTQQVNDLTQGGGPLGHGFIENAGQWNSKARYYTSAGDTRVWITNSSVVYDFFEPVATSSRKPGAAYRGHVVSMEFQNSSIKSAAAGANEIARKVNFIDGNGSHPARSYSEADIKGLYDGVDLHLTKEDSSPRFDLIVAPGHNVSNILVNYRGANGLTQNKDGTLSLGTSIGDRKIAQLRAFQNVAGAKTPVDVKFDLHSDGLVGFKVGRYDKAKALTIDPVIYSTFIGDNGSSFTEALGVAVGEDSAPVITGFTTAPDFPTTLGAYNLIVNGTCLFVTKFSQDGTHLLFSTVINSNGFACGTFDQVDSTGRVVVAGFAGPGYPLANPFQPQGPAANDVENVLSVLSPDGSKLVYSTYYGHEFNIPGAFGFGGDSGSFGFGDVQNIGDDTKLPGNAFAPSVQYGHLLNLQVDATNRIYLIGQGTIATTSNAYQKTPSADSTYVACFNPIGTISYATYYGGPNSGTTGGTVAPDGGVFLCGYTSGGIAATSGAFQTQSRGQDGFVTKLSPVTSGATKMTVAFTTYLGGSGPDDCRGIAVDSNGEPFVWGDSDSTDFPITLGAFDSNGTSTYYVAKFDAGGANLLYATYIAMGGSYESQSTYPAIQFESPIITCIAVDPEGDCYLTGSINTYIPGTGIPSTDGSAMRPYNPAQPFADKAPIVEPPKVTPGDAFMEVFNPTGTGLVYSGFIGGTYDDQAEQVAIDSGSNCYMVGWTDSFNETVGVASAPFPTTGGAFDTTYFEPTGLGTNAPYTFWNDAFNPKGGPDRMPMGFLTKFRVTSALYLTQFNVPVVVQGGTTGTGSVMLNQPPQFGNVIPVEVISSNQALIPSFEVEVRAPSPTNPYPPEAFGIAAADVTVDTPVTLTAYHDGVYLTRGLHVVPFLQGFSVDSPSIVGGNTTTARVYLSATIPAPSPPRVKPYTVSVTLVSSDPTKAVAVPNVVTIESLSSNGLVGIQTFGVDDPTSVTFTAQITATDLPNTIQQLFAYTPTAPLQLLPASVSNVVFNPQIVLGGYSSQGEVVMNGQAGPTPITVNLTETSGTAPVALNPLSVTVMPGDNKAGFLATTQVVFGNLFRTVTATQVNNGATAEGTLFVNPILLGAMQLVTPTITGGSEAQAYVVLSAPAGPGGVKVGLVSSNPSFAALQFPSVVVPAGSSRSPIFLIKTPITDVAKTVSITANLGVLSASNSLTVEPEGLTLKASTSTVVGSLGGITFNLTLPVAEQNGTLHVAITSNGGSALTIPSSVPIPAGFTKATFTGASGLVTSNKLVTVTASIPSIQGELTASTTVEVVPLPLILNISPQNLVGGVQNGKGTVTLAAPAAAATTVQISSNNTSAAIPSPASIVIPKGSQVGSFTVVSKVVSAQTQVQFTVKDASGSNSAPVTILAPQVALTKLTIANPVLAAGASTSGTVFASGTIPAGGLPISLSASNASAQVSPTVTLPQGATSVSFPISTALVSAGTTVTITASFGKSTVSANMTVTAVVVGALTLTPGAITGGGSVSMTLTITAPAPAGGVSVLLTQTSSLLANASAGITVNGQVIPMTGSKGPFPSVVIPAGQTQTTVQVVTPIVSSPQTTTITGVFVGQNAQASGQLQVNPPVQYNP